MAKSERQLDELRERLGGLLEDWGTEIAAVMRALENQQSQASAQDGEELAKLRQRVRERDMALDHLTKTSKERDSKFAELEKELKAARTRVDELERQQGALDQPGQESKVSQQAELEAMRAELAARKSLIKSLRTDAERGKALEKEIAGNREVLAKMKTSIERHTKTIAELRRGADSWERKYRELAETAGKRLSRESDGVPRGTAAAAPAAQRAEVDGTKTIVIDMTEPLRKANDERRRKTDRR